jgi:hypothetical protein
VAWEIAHRFDGDNHDRTTFATRFLAPPLYSTNITNALFEFSQPAGVLMPGTTI